VNAKAVVIQTDPSQMRRMLIACASAILLAVSFLVMQAAAAFAQDRPPSFADLAELVSPSVVNITTSTTIAERTMPRGVVPEGSPFEDFFNNGPRGGPQRSSALGSGFVISSDGFIVTNNHVIEGADEILIEFYSGVELPAELIGTDPNTDIAVLKVDATDLPFVAFGDSNAEGARVGDWVMAMGNPLGQGFSVSVGIVSARNRALSGTYDDYIPDRCRDQPWQFGGSIVQHGRSGHRREHGDPVAHGRVYRDRFCHVVRRCGECRRSADRIRRNPPWLAGCTDSGCDT